MHDEVIAVFENEDDILSLNEKLSKFAFDDLVKHPHFYYSLDEKGTNLQFIKDRFRDFDRIKMVTRRKHGKSGKINYDFYYLLDNNYYLIYAIDLNGEKPILINAYYVERNFKRYKDWLIKDYRKKLSMNG